MSSALPRLSPSSSILLNPEPLTPSSFSTFGTAILPPLPHHLSIVPNHPPQPLYRPHQPSIVSANQRTALKTSPISPLSNHYPASSSSNGNAEAKGLMSIFSCFPRRNTYLDPSTEKLRLKLEILERHPFTTQTFCPFNFSSSSPGPQTTNLRSSSAGKTYFVVIVAPTLHDPTATPPNPPDLSRVRAFLAPVTADGGAGMAVTYAPGTWHAPMVVIGERRVDFLVSQFANGRSGDDVQEVEVGDVSDGKNIVEVDLAGLGIGIGSEEEGLWKAKL